MERDDVVWEELDPDVDAGDVYQQIQALLILREEPDHNPVLENL